MPELPPFDGTEYPEQHALQASLERQVGIDPFFGTDEMVTQKLKSFKALVEKCNDIDVQTSDLRHVKLQDILNEFDNLKQSIEKYLGIGLSLDQDDYVFAGDHSGQAGEMFSRLAAFGVIKDLPSIENSEDKTLKDSIDLSSPNEITCKYVFPLFDSTSGQTLHKICELKINRFKTQEEINQKYSEFQSEAEKLLQKHSEELADFYKKYGKISRKTVSGKPSERNRKRKFYRIDQGTNKSESV